MSSSRVVPKRRQRVIYLNILLVFDIVLVSCGPVARAATAEPEPQKSPITITVISNEPGKKIKTAIARILGTTDVATLEENKIMLPHCSTGNYISIWAPEHLIETRPCVDNQDTYELTLTLMPMQDNVDYAWMSAQTCAGCHSDSQGRTEYLEWTQDKHSRVFLDSYFWTIYSGTDINGNVGAITGRTISENGQFSRVPNNSEYGPGFRLDYPNENGNCAYCHAPAAVKRMDQRLTLNAGNSNIPGGHGNAETEGITCDVCHKVADVLIENNRLPFAERPGSLSFLFLRPGTNQLFNLGPLPDMKLENSNVKASCAPIFSESKFCAACHYGKFFDTVIYNSYGEWLNSSYSNPATGNFRSCQDCHMHSAQDVGDTALEQRAACSASNQNFRNFNHNMMERDNTGDPALVKGAATLSLTARIENGQINVAVQVENTRAGHKFPTDSPLRHLILLVEANDQNEMPLAQVAGPTIPLWGGVGTIADEDYAGRPGEIYANILKDRDTNQMPTIAFWNPTVPAWDGSDTRLEPNKPVQSEYSFAVPSNGEATITAKLIYRYAFIEIIRQKKWIPNDIIVSEAVPVQVP